MWSDETRPRYERKNCRYPSDLTDEEWALIQPHMPPVRQKSRKPPPDQRDVMNACLYVLTTGCQWRQLPKDFPPKSTVHDYFIDWQCTGVLARIHHALYVEARRLSERADTPSLAIIDSQSVKSAEKGGRAATRRATMQPRKSKARSATSLWTRSA
jgi:transposase